ncbi:hypothetical protein BGZ54_007755 [Gamsiella multidivaricata]|nr:hypothetical protein BGZ54_007755 [Gamsiella multidivaricata]
MPTLASELTEQPLDLTTTAGLKAARAASTSLEAVAATPILAAPVSPSPTPRQPTEALHRSHKAVIKKRGRAIIEDLEEIVCKSFDARFITL